MTRAIFQMRAAVLAAAAALLLAALIAVSAAHAAPENAPPADAASAAASPDAAEPEEADPEAVQKELCTLIETAANDHEIPVGFFTRLIWKESRFRHDAVSPKGAQGIAQFMPGTALERGLEDPFDARAAVPASASLLADLKRRFGNLGLAAAAYNAGANRVHNWLSQTSTLPYETRDYVLSITGAPAETWADSDVAPKLSPSAGSESDCLTLAALLKGPGSPLTPEIETGSAPWGVQISGGHSKARVVDAYLRLKERFAELIGDRPPMIVAGRLPGGGTRAFYRVRVPVETRAEGEKLCAELKRGGGSCIVLKT